MEASDPRRVQDTLASMADNPNDSRELEFDPNTGRIMVKGPNEQSPSPDAVPASEIAKEGFFSTYK